jgi:hypothetical protein
MENRSGGVTHADGSGERMATSAMLDRSLDTLASAGRADIVFDQPARIVAD